MKKKITIEFELSDKKVNLANRDISDEIKSIFHDWCMEKLTDQSFCENCGQDTGMTLKYIRPKKLKIKITEISKNK